MNALAIWATLAGLALTAEAAPDGSKSAIASANRLMLDHAVIVTQPDEPSYVQYAVEDLAAYLKELTGNSPSVERSLSQHPGVTIAVGSKAAEQVLRGPLPNDRLGEEGYLLRTVGGNGTDYILAAGGTPRGTKAALAAVMKAIQSEGKSVFVPAPLDVLSQPAFATRGMHFNGWPFNAPYSFRAWREEDWQRYLDILSYQGVNLFYLWPFMEIMPVPLSEEDRAYLEECRRVVDYAQKKHGMEVWIMQCANRVAKDRCGVADPRKRPYWRPVQEDLNPGSPKDFQAIMESREAMYRIINNADGVCNIDSDPGECPGCPLSDYLKVLKGCRALLDRHNLHGRQTKLINWMWTGWGQTPQTFFQPDHQRLTIEELKANLPEPWGLVSGLLDFLPLCQEQQVLQKTVLLPYGWVEGEPAYPETNLRFDEIRAGFDKFVGKYPELAGVMGNAQTPLLQLPHVFFFTSTLWDLDYRGRPEREVLLELAALLYPEHKELIADSYLAFREQEPAKVEILADQLEKLLRENRLGRAGLFGRKLFPDARIVAQDLALQLRLRAARQRLIADIDKAPRQAVCVKLLQDYMAAYLAWDIVHGWHALWGWDQWPLGAPALDPQLAKAARKAGHILGDAAAVARAFEQISRALSPKYGEEAVETGCIAPLKSAIAAELRSLAQKARVSASVVPDPAKYPPGAANDGDLSTRYWPGALVQNNTEWLQLTWDTPQTFDEIVVRFLQHPSMRGRTIHLQKEVAPGQWEDFATTVIPNDPTAPYAMAKFQLPTRVTLDKIRVVNLLDLFEIEVR